MPEFIVKRGVMFDGEPHHPGDTITLTEEQAASLVRIGALEPVSEPEPKKPGPKPKPEGAA